MYCETPLLEISINHNGWGSLFVKLELLHPLGSHKARTVTGILDDYEQHGKLERGSGRIIADSSGGNLAKAMAIEAKYRGYRAFACIERSYSEEKRALFRALGGTTIPQLDKLTAFESIQEWLADTDESPIYLNQFNNTSNMNAHKYRTGGECLYQIQEKKKGQLGSLALIGGLGSGASLIGVGAALQEKLEPDDLEIIAVQPDGCDYENDVFVTHSIQGIGLSRTRFQKLFPDMIDRYISIKPEHVNKGQDWLFRKSKVFTGYSTGANIYAALTVVEEKAPWPNADMLTFAYDSGIDYLK